MQYSREGCGQWESTLSGLEKEGGVNLDGCRY